jgi:hypothetical protein
MLMLWNVNACLTPRGVIAVPPAPPSTARWRIRPLEAVGAQIKSPAAVGARMWRPPCESGHRWLRRRGSYHMQRRHVVPSSVGFLFHEIINRGEHYNATTSINSINRGGCLMSTASVNGLTEVIRETISVKAMIALVNPFCPPRLRFL